MIERERLEKELSLAHKIQSTFLQQDIPQLDGYDIWAVSRPCYEIGGDYMQLAKLSDTEYLAIIADVSGKGIPAALITLALHAAIMIFLPIGRDTNKPQVVATRVEYTTLINEILRSVTGGRAFVTFCPVIIYSEENKLNFCNCGHTEPIVIRKNGNVERVASQTPVLGLLENIEPVMESVQMDKGDIICMFTDGVDEAASGPADENGNRDEFGVERLVELLKKNMQKSAMEITDIIIEAIDEYTSEYRIEDDVTLVIIKKK
jgi:sigma-B regulation protein RsbU (phosphoserine phosphatase)